MNGFKVWGGRGAGGAVSTLKMIYTVQSLSSYGSWWAPYEAPELKRLVNLEDSGIKAADRIQEPG